MDNTRKVWRRNRGYILLLVCLLAYAMLPNQCASPLTIILQDAGDLMDWISTWPEDLN